MKVPKLQSLCCKKETMKIHSVAAVQSTRSKLLVLATHSGLAFLKENKELLEQSVICENHVYNSLGKAWAQVFPVYVPFPFT